MRNDAQKEINVWKDNNRHYRVTRWLAWDAWNPDLTEYDCIVLDYNGEMWPEDVRKDFVDYVRGGGGVVVVHAANNSFVGWKEYEQASHHAEDAREVAPLSR